MGASKKEKWERRRAWVKAKKRAPVRVGAWGPITNDLPARMRKPQTLPEWIEAMECWGMRVRYELVRLEAWLADTRRQEGCTPDFEINDPGDPPPKPW